MSEGRSGNGRTPAFKIRRRNEPTDDGFRQAPWHPNGLPATPYALELYPKVRAKGNRR